MLKRNKILVAFIAVTVLCASIGFAAISDTLNVSGSVALNLDSTGELNQEFDKNVVFTNPMGTTASVTTSEISTDGDKYTFAIDASAFNKVGDSVTVTVDIRNDNSTDAALKVNNITEGDLADDITVSALFAGSASSATVGSEKTTTLTITVTLEKVPQTTASSNISFTITATPAA